MTTKTKYFFTKLRAIYGVGLYRAAYKTPEDVVIAMREYEHQIEQYSEGQIDRAFDVLKFRMQKGECLYINIPFVLGLLSAGNAIKKPTHESYDKESAREAYEKWRDIMVSNGWLK